MGILDWLNSKIEEKMMRQNDKLLKEGKTPLWGSINQPNVAPVVNQTGELRYVLIGKPSSSG